jgi:RNA 3'-terminal phosphate cyclase (ATP)
MVELDGSFGEGGGQILRTSLALSLITQQPFHLFNIRQRRKKPGLRRQHLRAVRAAEAVGNASVDGAHVDSSELVFRPGAISPGAYHFDIGSAGSTTLVFQTVLPVLLMCNEASTLLLEGGTHNNGAPPLDFLEKALVPLINRMGPSISVNHERYGFAPAGGGRWKATIDPRSGLKPLHVGERGKLRQIRVRALISKLPSHIAERELDTVRKQVSWAANYSIETVESPGPGNIVLIEIESNVTEVFTGFGQRSVPAEAVASEALRCAQAYLDCEAPVGEHLADQLMLPLALAGGGSYESSAPTLHSTTNAEVIERFLGRTVRIEQTGSAKARFVCK